MKHRTAPAEKRSSSAALRSGRERLDRSRRSACTWRTRTRGRSRPVSSGRGGGRLAARATLRCAAAPGRRARLYPRDQLDLDGRPACRDCRANPAGRCDRVLIWNVPWHYLTRLSDAFSQTCLPTTRQAESPTSPWRAACRLDDHLREGDAHHRRHGTACREWIVARSTTGAAGLAGDGTILGAPCQRYRERRVVRSSGAVRRSHGQPTGRVDLRGQRPCCGAPRLRGRHDPDAGRPPVATVRVGELGYLPAAGHACRAHTARNARRL